MKYPCDFRARLTREQLEFIKKTSEEFGGPPDFSQQAVVRWAIDTLKDELDRVQGSERRLGSIIVAPAVDVGQKAPPPKRRHRRKGEQGRKTKPTSDPRVADGRSVESVALRRLAGRVKEIESSRPSDR